MRERALAEADAEAAAAAPPDRRIWRERNRPICPSPASEGLARLPALPHPLHHAVISGRECWTLPHLVASPHPPAASPHLPGNDTMGVVSPVGSLPRVAIPPVRHMHGLHPSAGDAMCCSSAGRWFADHVRPNVQPAFAVRKERRKEAIPKRAEALVGNAPAQGMDGLASGCRLWQRAARRPCKTGENRPAGKAGGHGQAAVAQG